MGIVYLVSRISGEDHSFAINGVIAADMPDDYLNGLNPKNISYQPVTPK